MVSSLINLRTDPNYNLITTVSCLDLFVAFFSSATVLLTYLLSLMRMADLIFFGKLYEPKFEAQAFSLFIDFAV